MKVFIFRVAIPYLLIPPSRAIQGRRSCVASLIMTSKSTHVSSQPLESCSSTLLSSCKVAPQVFGKPVLLYNIDLMIEPRTPMIWRRVVTKPG